MAHTNSTKPADQDLQALPSDDERLLLTFTATVLQSVETLIHNSWVRVDGDALERLQSLRELAKRVQERMQKRNGH